MMLMKGKDRIRTNVYTMIIAYKLVKMFFYVVPSWEKNPWME